MTTQAIFFLSQLDDKPRPALAHATHYQPVELEAFAALLARVPAELVRRATFVDLGSGMGRAVLLASRHPFKQVVGVELSPSLHEVAKANVEHARGLGVRCRDVRLRCSDVRRYRFPPGDLVLFAFNPFDDVVLRVALERAVASRGPGERALFLYNEPVHREMVVSEFARRTIADDANGLVVELRVP